MAEFALIELIRERCAVQREDVRVGIGDDAAVLAVPNGQHLAVSTDTLLAGTHFPQNTKAYDVGWKALAVNLSDLAAMGATPAWATLALTLPEADHGWVGDFADGFAALAREFKLALVGGDTTQGPLTITITVHGFVPPEQALLRSGARVGDLIMVTGTLGDAAAGLRCLNALDEHAGTLMSAPLATREHLLTRLNRPLPRVAAGLALRGRASAAIDLSDGLLADLGHICRLSGVGAELDLVDLPTSPALFALFDSEQRARLQLSGGDDYELCFCVPASVAGILGQDLARVGCGATRIGRIVAGAGVRVRNADGGDVAVSERGWEHFS